MRHILFIMFMLCSVSFYAQDLTISGKVTSGFDNETLPSVSIIIKGSTTGTITDINGIYELKVPDNAVLVFSMIGFENQEIVVAGRKVIDVVLQESNESLDEVVVVGYGSVKRSDLTSSISTVKGDDLKTMSVGNAMSALQGKANGVQVTNGGSPGEVPRVIIRGVSTTNGSDPLYVVDGMPVGTNINFLLPEDIESVEVLKDASASAIYGTRGSNGVVLVSTKKGKLGKTKFQFSTSLGVQTIGNPDMAGAAEYELVRKAAYTNDGATPIWNTPEGAVGTDWWDAVINDAALVQNYYFSFQGGTEKFTFSGSLGYFRQESQYDYGYWDKLTARFNTEYNFTTKIKFGVDFAPSLQTYDNTPSLFGAAMSMDPTTPVYLPEEQWTDDEYSNYQRSYNNQEWNPVASIGRLNAHTKEYGLLMNPYISIEAIKGLTVRTQFGINTKFSIADDYQPSFYIDNLEKRDQSYVSRKMSDNVDWNWTNTVNYATEINNKHNISVMLGYTMEKFSNYWLSGSRENTPSNIDELQYVSAGTLNQQTSGTDSYSTLISYLGRVMYNYSGKYYLTGSLRTDGSSKFSEGNKYAIFPAVSGAWRISEENFMQNKTIFDSVKLRMGWGRVGNQNIPSSAYVSLIGSADYVFNGVRSIGTSVSQVANTSLIWETVEDYNIGLDLGIMNSRLNVTVDLFKKHSKDMLLNKENLLILGFPDWNGAVWTNIGSMNATGWEFSINWNDKKGDFGYNLGLNLSSVKNVAEKLYGETPIYSGTLSGSSIIRNEEEGEISRFWGYECNGIFQNWTEVNAHTDENGTMIQPYAQPGDLRFKDNNHDGTLDDNDKAYIGSAFPDLMVGFNASLSYKNVDLIASFYGTYGNDVFNKTKQYYSNFDGANVYAGTINEAWHGEGTSNDIPRLSASDLNGNYKTVSSFFVEDGSFLRCKLLQFGYTLPKNAIKGAEIRLSLSAQNLFTITNYSGMDPERAALGGVLESGIDNTGYPNPRTALFGLNINF